MQAQDLLKKTDKLPNVPDVVRELIQLLNSNDAQYSDITAKIVHDQTMSLRVLRMVNSAYFGLSRKVSSIEEAIVFLGLEKLKNLVIASGFTNSVTQINGIDLSAFWKDSFRVGELCQWFAKRTTLVDESEAFTVGIVHNIGLVLLHLTEPDIAKQIQQRVADRKAVRMQAELDALGFTSQEAGKALMDMWNFPPDIGNAVLHYQRPFENMSEEEQPDALACVLNLASYLNACIRYDRDPDLVRQGFPKTVAEAAGLSDGVIYELDEALMIDEGLNHLLF